MERTINYVQLVKQEMDQLKLKYTVREKEDGDVMFLLGMSVQNCPNLQVMMIVNEEDGDFKLRSYLLHDVPEQKMAKICDVVCKLNGQYRFVKIYPDEDRDVCAGYDMTLMCEEGSEELAGRQAMLSLVRFVQICDECVPPLLMVQWGAFDKE